MALTDDIRRKAREYIVSAIKQAHPQSDVSDGSPIKSLFAVPASFALAAVVEDLDVLRNLYLGNFSQISREEMDRLAGNLLVSRPPGTKAVTTLRVFVNEATKFKLRQFPYFETDNGVAFQPNGEQEIGPSNLKRDSNGELFAPVPVIASEVGQQGEVPPNSITNFRNAPGPVTRVNNPQGAVGGSASASNEKFFDRIKNSMHNPTLNQPSGLSEYIIENYSDARDIEIIDAGHKRMMRDEIWHNFDVGPNLRRIGSPGSPSTTIKNVDFDNVWGHAKTSGDEFSPSDEGRRVVVGNKQSFRLIQKVIGPREVIISGPRITGTHDLTVWTEGPHVGNMSDVYMYFPSVFIQSKVVDPRNILVTTQKITNSQRLYFERQDGGDPADLATSGKLIFDQGAQDERRREPAGISQDQNGYFFNLHNKISLEDKKEFVQYPTDPVIIGPEGDIQTRPVIHILGIKQLDPITLDPVKDIPPTENNPYASKGWYWNVPEPSKLMSSKEEKEIHLDDKTGDQIAKPLDVTGWVSEYKSASKGNAVSISWEGKNKITIPSPDNFGKMEGRPVTIQLKDEKLQEQGDGHSSWREPQDLDKNNNPAPEEFTIDPQKLDIKYFSDKGWRDHEIQFHMRDKDNPTSSNTHTFDGSEIKAAGDTIVIKGTQSFPDYGSDTSDYEVKVNFTGTKSLHTHASDVSGSLSTVIRRVYTNKRQDDTAEVDIEVNNGTLVGVVASNGPEDASGHKVQQADVNMNDLSGEFETTPIRVDYATHQDIRNLQDQLDNGEVRDLCEDTLARSMRPSIMDVELEYEGPMSPDEIESSLLGILEQAVSSGETTSFDVSDVIAALDSEPLLDRVGTNPLFRVENLLRDGTWETRYLNPTNNIKQKFTIKGQNVTQGDDEVPLRPESSEPDHAGRGKLILGGNDPSKREVLPYEGSIKKSSDKILFILRSGKTLSHDHRNYETAWAVKRDFDPELEFENNVLKLPKNNRPYLRDVLITKTG